MRVEPIPKYLLPHDVVLRKISKGKYEEETTESEIAVNNVRVEALDDSVLNKTNNEFTSKLVLFYDFENSTKGVEFRRGDKVIYDNEEYRVVSIDKICAFKEHHLEIGLV